MPDFIVADPPHHPEDIKVDVLPITSDSNNSGTFLVGARLCNFPTGQASLRSSYLEWVSKDVDPLLRPRKSASVFLGGHASRLGDPISNQKLSRRRLDAVKSLLTERASAIGRPLAFKEETAFGESDPEAQGIKDSDNSGRFRAVDVLFFSTDRPPELIPRPQFKRLGFQNFKIAILGAIQGGALVVVAGASLDLVLLEMQDSRGSKARFVFAGGGAAGALSITAIILAVRKAITSGKIIALKARGGLLGPPTSFRTTEPVLFSDFEGAADAVILSGKRKIPIQIPFPRGPGIPIIPPLVVPVPTLDLSLHVKAKGLFVKRALVAPNPIKMQAKIGLPLDSSLKGALVLIP